MSFEVVPIGIPSSAQDCIRAMAVAPSDLPELDERQAEEVAKFGLNEDRYKRMRLLVRRFAKDRELAQGKRFGEFIEDVLRPLEGVYRLQAITRRGTPDGWTVSIFGPSGTSFEFRSTFEVVSAILDGTASQDDLQYYVESVLNQLQIPSRLAATS